MINLSNFSERLTDLIFEAGKTQKQLASELGCSQSTISRYMSGAALPTLEMTVALADYFNCSTDFLLGLTQDNNELKFNRRPPFGERISAICAEKGISRYKLQKLTHISESVMRYWVRGKTAPSVLNAVLIAEKLGVSLDYLLGREV